MKRSYFKRKVYKPLKRTKLRSVGKSETSIIKAEIQAILREIVILRDGGCFLRHYRQTGACGGFRKDGKLILQAEHLHTRANSASYADSRLVVCICLRHHIYYKPQHPNEYYEIVKAYIGKARANLLKLVMEDKKPHKMDWKLELLGLKQELETLKDDTIVVYENS